MAEFIIMPRQGQSVESCIITKWHKKEGDEVKKGDLLFTYETDKATFDEEAKNDGFLLKTLFNVDDDVPCLENVCIIGNKNEDISAMLGGKTDSNEKPVEEKAAVPVVAEIKAEEKAATSLTAKEDFIRVSPRARNLADKLGIDYSLATPTGAEGRIIERDIETVASEGVISLRNDEKSVVVKSDTQIAAVQNIVTSNALAYTDEKISNMRKTISKAMLNSLQTTAQLTHTASFDATEIMAFRKKIKPAVEKGELNNITLNDIIMYAVSRMLLKYKAFNAHLLGDTMRYFSSVNLAMAVDTPRGLMVPVCLNADKKSLNQLAVELKALAFDCQKGTIKPDLLTGGSFTVSNLGVFGTESFTPILNAPQTGILGVNTITTRIREEDGQVKPYPCMTLSLTYDHRAMDGVTAAKFLQDICKSLENFTVTLATGC